MAHDYFSATQIQNVADDAKDIGKLLGKLADRVARFPKAEAKCTFATILDRIPDVLTRCKRLELEIDQLEKAHADGASTSRQPRQRSK